MTGKRQVFSRDEAIGHRVPFSVSRWVGLSVGLSVGRSVGLSVHPFDRSSIRPSVIPSNSERLAFFGLDR